MTRAYFELLRLDIKAAFGYHPLFIIPPIIILLYINKKHINDSLYKGIWILTAIIFVVVYLYRMIVIKDSVVVFEPENGFYFKVLKSFINMLI